MQVTIDWLVSDEALEMMGWSSKRHLCICIYKVYLPLWSTLAYIGNASLNGIALIGKYCKSTLNFKLYSSELVL